MPTPTTDQIQTAIGVLKRLEEHLNTRAEYSVMQLPESPVGAHQVGQIRVSAIEQTTRIEDVVSQLAEWRTELSQESDPYATRHI